MTAQKSWRRLLATATAGLLVASGLALAPTAASAAPGDVTEATLEWGVKASFRNYIYNFPQFKGQGTLLGTAAQPEAKGAVLWSGGTGTSAKDGSLANVAFGTGNGIHFQSHPMAAEDGTQTYALDLQFTNPRIEVTSATTGELHLDVVGREFKSMTELGEQYTLTDVNMANVSLAAPAKSDGTLSWIDAPATLTAEGSQAFGGFYSAGEVLDPVSFTLPVEGPRVTVTGDTDLLSGEQGTVTVTGTGFTPDGVATNGTRPPLAGQFGGAYVVFGSFLDTWRPSAGAAASARKVLEQKWALPASSIAIAGAQGVLIDEDGSFQTTLTTKEYATALADGNYGVYTYIGSGATYAPFETFTPVTFSTVPAVSTQPAAVSVIAGNSAVFSAAADGSPAPTVQWQSSVAGGAWSDINGATDATYTLANARVAASGTSYRAVFTNAVGSVETEAASLEVAPAQTTTSVRFSPTTFAYNVAKTATVTVSSKNSPLVPTGKVSLKINGKSYSATLSGGKAAVKLTTPVAAGSRSVPVSYLGSADAKASSGTTTVKVTKATPSVSAKLSSSSVSTKQNAKVSVAVAVPGTLNAKASKLKVQVYDGSKRIATATLNTSGKVNVKLPKLKAGSHKIKVKFVGDANLTAKNSATRTLKVK